MVDRSLEDIKIPMLLLQTAGDNREAIALLETYAALAPQAILQKLPDPEVNPEQELARVIRSFLREIYSSSY